MKLQKNVILQLQELQLIKFSLLPGELLEFLDEPPIWSFLLDRFTETGTLTDCDDPYPESLPPAQFLIRLEASSKLCFHVEIPPGYIPQSDNLGEVQALDEAKPIVLVKGANITRQDQGKWQAFVKEKSEELLQAREENLVFQLISLHLIPLLHAELPYLDSMAESHPNDAARPEEPLYHALLTSHHLLAHSKRRALQQWASEHCLTGFAKVGHPGVLYAYGPRMAVEEFVGNVKALQWLALRVRFVEPLEGGDAAVEDGGEGRVRWVEFEKVGKVVEEMRRLGRESFVVEMGIGSAGGAK